MFRKINYTSDYKKNILNKHKEKNYLLKEELSNFFDDEFGKLKNNLSFVIDYNIKNNSVVITTNSKVVANELTSRLVSLNNFLKNRNIYLDRILVK